MPDYYYTATDRITRTRETNCIEATSAQDAMRQLEAAELDEIVLHTDDVTAAISNMMPRKVEVNEYLSAAEYVSLRSMGDFAFFMHLIKKMYWQSRWSILISVGLALFIFLRANDFQRTYANIGLIAVLCGWLLPLLIALITTWYSPTRKFNQIQEDFFWGRWNEVLKRLPKVRKHLPLIEARAREAASLAGLGRLDEALKTMEPLADNPEIPRWMYLSRLAEVYECNDRMEQCLELRRQASEMAPDNSALKLGYANSLLKLNLNPQLAHQLIQEAEAEPLSDQIQMFLPVIKGVLELNLGHYRLAFYQLVEAENGLNPYLSTQPSARLYADVGRAYAAIALAEMGDTKEAEPLFQSALPRLQALNAKRTIERYRRAVSR